MDEVAMLRALVAAEPQHNRQAEAEVWNRLQRRRPQLLGRRFSSRLGVIAVSAATLAALTAAAVVVFTGSVDVPTAEAACSRQTSSPAACLNSLARLAASASAPGRIVYQRAIGFSQTVRVLPPKHKGAGLHLRGVTEPFNVRQLIITETWIDRTSWRGARRETTKLSFPTGRDRAAWRAAGSPSLNRIFANVTPVHSHGTADGERLYVMDFGALQRATGTKHPDQALPSNPDGVLRLIRRLNSDMAVGAIMLPGDDPLLRPAQRAAIFKALAQVPGVRILGAGRDALGRREVLVATPWRGHGVWLTLYDPRTSRMLADGAFLGGQALVHPLQLEHPELAHPDRLGHLTWLWTFTVDAATAPRLLAPPIKPRVR